MSFQAMTWALSQPTSNSGQKLVLLLLANHCNHHTGQCNPSHKLLAEECSMGISTLKTHISVLQEAGYLTIIHKSLDGVSLPNQYKLNLAGVGQILAGGGSESDGRVGQNLATNQEVKTGIEPKGNQPVGFTSFWRVYPNKKAKPAALKAFNKAKVTDITLILNHIDVMTRSEQWQNVQYIPFPATYLNQRRWEDDTIAPTNQFAGFK